MFDKFKDECGVFGIFGHPEAANMTYLGLYALQHRGQESAGIAASDGAQVRISREMGYVADIFDGETLSSLPGPLSIGHVRYSTAGESKLLNAQPILIDCAHGQIALCHNGNIVNARELRDDLVQQGSIFQSNSDTEVILHLYARSKARSVEDAIVESVAQVQGAFSLVMLTKDRLIAVRDPHGFRPLALGRLGDAYIVCSETCALDLIGGTYVRDVEPGEVVIISDGGLRSLRPFPPAPLAHCVFEHVYFARPDSYVFGKSVNAVRTELGRILADESAVPADVIVPIPDSGVCPATGFAERSGKATARPRIERLASDFLASILCGGRVHLRIATGQQPGDHAPANLRAGPDVVAVPQHRLPAPHRLQLRDRHRPPWAVGMAHATWCIAHTRGRARLIARLGRGGCIHRNAMRNLPWTPIPARS